MYYHLAGITKLKSFKFKKKNEEKIGYRLSNIRNSHYQKVTFQ
jgi:hypothetical protein